MISILLLLLLCEKCPNTEIFLVRISRIRTEFGKIRTRKNSVFGQFSRSISLRVLDLHKFYHPNRNVVVVKVFVALPKLAGFPQLN